jgi:nucleotide-binding universal stress UspA family protein
LASLWAHHLQCRFTCTLEANMKVLLAVDGSVYSKRMLAYLAAHNELLGGEHRYTALTVTPGAPLSAEIYVNLDELRKLNLEQAEGILRPVRAFAQQNKWSLETLALEGDPATLISEQANAGHFDLVVMGSHGRSPLIGLVLGSVANRVLAQCKTPVLLIR